MKTNRLLLAVASVSLIAASAVCLPELARADAPQGLGTWEGAGVTTEASGKETGPFTLTLTRKALGAGGVRTDGKVRTGDGREIVIWQETTDAPGGRFRITSNNGAGGGCCFANAMCQSLEERGDGTAFATTISKDGPEKLRVLVTELKDGHAVRFHAQTLVKKP